MFDELTRLPPDPILGLSSAFKDDENPNKILLGVGVYQDENGKTPILKSVAQAQSILLEKETSKVYISPLGVPGFVDGMLDLLLGRGHSAISESRVAAVQTPGGCGALHLLGLIVKRAHADATVWVSDPTWSNHIPLMKNAGLSLKTYPYLDRATGGILYKAMVDCFRNIPRGDVVLLHGCCHNPTGADLDKKQWDQLLLVLQDRELVPFIDIAYQGMGDGVEEDGYGLRLLASSVPEVIIAASCSKNFGLYRERVGLAAIVCRDQDTRDASQSQLQDAARGSYSMPPSYGGALVDIILHDNQLRKLWESEVADIRRRLKDLRQLLLSRLIERGAAKDFSFIVKQRGMYTMLGLSHEQIQRLRYEKSVYIVDSSRINIAGVNQSNVEYLVDALVSVL